MAETESVEDLAKLYDMLKADAKSMVRDLSEGIGMYRFTGILLLYLSLLGFFLVYLTENPVPPPGWWRIVADVAALALGIAGAGGALFARTKYRQLKTKYSKLFEVADKVR